MKRSVILLCASLLSLPILSQERVKPGRIYEEGEEVLAPRIGFSTVVPEGWFGTLPQGEEVFALLPVAERRGYMFINAYKSSLADLRQRWMRGFSLTETITVSIDGDPVVGGNAMSASFDVTGAPIPLRGYAKAMDGGHGFVVSLMLLAPAETFENDLRSLEELAATSTFAAPRTGSVYQDFVWNEFLQQLYLVSWISAAHMKEQNHLWLCPDGTFRTKIKSRGIVADARGPYRGRGKGTWTAEGTGPSGNLLLRFYKKPLLTVQLEIRDDKIYLNGERFYGMQNEQCK